LKPRASSILALALMVAGIVVLYLRGALFGRDLPSIAVQVAAVALMVWARATFGMRSFHAAANPTPGGLVTTGPYRFVRHPIYAAATYFAWAGALDHLSATAAGAAALLTAGAVLRMLAEERLLIGMYPAYADYKSRTARIIPYIL
jgi:protein-S-isoprenylcysteine O-methyltransferase Ste14